MKHPTYTIDFYRDKKKQWRARIVHKNGRIILETSESYKRRIDVVKSTDNLLEAVKISDYEINE